jgi:hypothetical protein
LRSFSCSLRHFHDFSFFTIIRIQEIFFRKWGWKTQRTNKAHAEYQLRKSLLEKDDLKRWEYLDWNLEQEITAFGHRIQCEMDQYKFSQLLNGDHNPEYIITVLKKIIDQVQS